MARNLTNYLLSPDAWRNQWLDLDYVADLIRGHIEKGARLNAELISGALKNRRLELTNHSFNQDLVSPQDIQEIQREISAGFSQIEVELKKLGDTFIWGFGEIEWQLELQNQTLKDILIKLQAPLDTLAKELRKRAEYAYLNSWIDEAEQDFLESEKKNYQDFSVHFSLGMIYLYQKIDLEKALKYFRQTAKYAQPVSPYHTAQSWFYISFIFYIQRRFPEAIEAVNQTNKMVYTIFGPDFLQFYYRLAKIFALLNKPDEATKNLKRAIRADKNYCLKADIDKDFDGIRPQVNEVFRKLKEDHGYIDILDLY
ncbi:MAG: hypothetical protein WC697_03590 [Patescibacteria group bacterium]|jgi:tetratricopeptide (TPR) repeat protein